MTYLLFLAVASGVFADEDPVPTTQYFGVAAGVGTGLGLSYRTWEGPVGWQITAVPVYNGPSFQSYSLGANGLITFEDYRWSRFFGYAGGAVFGTQFWSPLNWMVQSAVGIGIEFVFFDHLAVDFQGGLGALAPLPLEGSFYLGPVGSVALYYRM